MKIQFSITEIKWCHFSNLLSANQVLNSHVLLWIIGNIFSFLSEGENDVGGAFPPTRNSAPALPLPWQPIWNQTLAPPHLQLSFFMVYRFLLVLERLQEFYLLIHLSYFSYYYYMLMMRGSAGKSNMGRFFNDWKYSADGKNLDVTEIIDYISIII